MARMDGQPPSDRLAMLMRPVCEACPFELKKDKIDYTRQEATPKDGSLMQSQRHEFNNTQSTNKIQFKCPKCQKPVKPFIKAQIGETDYVIEKADFIHP